MEIIKWTKTSTEFFRGVLQPNARFQQLIYLMFSVMNGSHYAMNNSSQEDLLLTAW